MFTSVELGIFWSAGIFLARHNPCQLQWLIIKVTVCKGLLGLTTESLLYATYNTLHRIKIYLTFLETQSWNPSNRCLLFLHVVIKALKKYFFFCWRLSAVELHARQRAVFLHYKKHNRRQTNCRLRALNGWTYFLVGLYCRALYRVYSENWNTLPIRSTS